MGNNTDNLTDHLAGRTILLTGGTGSFGQKFVETVLRDYCPKAIRILSRGEHLQYEMSKKFSDDRLRFFIGDIRDRDRIYRAMRGVDIVVHAAALKHVPIAEYNPREAVLTNVVGALNIIDAAIDCGVGKVIGISSDKACQPLNLYGATKMVMEKLLVQANVYSQDTKFSCVRYGNVAGSRGSVMPAFIAQSKSGTITITDERMTRFWLTLEQGVNFVVKCCKLMKGGEIFVPKIPSMRVTDLADVVAPTAVRNIVGIRPGEKLHEILITKEEARRTKEYDTYYVIRPEFQYWVSEIDDGKELDNGFQFTSNTNTEWLDKEDLRKIVNIIESDGLQERHKLMIATIEEGLNVIRRTDD